MLPARGDVVERPGGLVQAPEFAQFAVGAEALQGRGEGDGVQGAPEVFADGAGDGVFARVGQLGEGVVVLWASVRWLIR